MAARARAGAHPRLVGAGRGLAVRRGSARRLVPRLDPELVARELGLDSPSENSLDGTSARDVVAEFAYVAAQIGIDLSRFAEDVILWNTREFGFITLDDGYSTGSSIMPQKKNPDIAELARGKAGRLVGNLTGLLTTLKGLPLAYNRDLQEDKEPVFDSVATLEVLLPAFAGMIATLRFDTARMARSPRRGSRWRPTSRTGSCAGACRSATRTRHRARSCGCARSEGIELDDVTDEMLATASAELTPEVRQVLSIEGSIASRNGVGGTAPNGWPNSARSLSPAHSRRLMLWGCDVSRITPKDKLLGYTFLT